MSTSLDSISILIFINFNSICRTPLITVQCTEGLSWVNIRIIIIIIISRENFLAWINQNIFLCKGKFVTFLVLVWTWFQLAAKIRLPSSFTISTTFSLHRIFT